MSILVEQVPCAGTVPLILPVLDYPHIEASAGAGALVTPDLSYPAAPQYYTDHAGEPLFMVVPPEELGTEVIPNSSTWLTYILSQVVLVSPDVP